MAETKEQILKNIENDLNKYYAGDIKLHLDSGFITEQELLKAVDNDSEIVEAIKKFTKVILEKDGLKIKEITPKTINDYCTEIYFWGLPEAGKTWALAGILNTINKYPQGYFRPHKDDKVIIHEDYLNGLLGLIHNSKPINYLPDKTGMATIRYMNFKLLINKEERKVAFIDLSGELVKAMAKKQYADIKEPIKTLESLLNNKNRKLHFFFIDYTRVDDSDKNGQQNIHFTNLCTIFDSKKYFEKNTDFIYIVITKADMIDANENIRKNMAIKYLKENYPSFRNNIGKICQDNEIDNGDMYNCLIKKENNNKCPSNCKDDCYPFLDNYTLDFSIGEVLFNRMCRFNNKSSLKIVNILKEQVQKENKGKGWIFG